MPVQWRAVPAIVLAALLIACSGRSDEQTVRETVGDFVRALADDPPKAYTFLAHECKGEISFTEFAASRLLFEGVLGESDLKVEKIEIIDRRDDEMLANFDVVLVSEGEEIPLTEGDDGPLWFAKEDGRWRFADCAVFGAAEEPEATPVPAVRSLEGARAAEADEDPALPGEWVNLPEIYGDERGPARYGNRDGPTTAPHARRDVDYAEEQGLPPVGGPHWGNGACPSDPGDAPAFCGPAPWGIYRTPWQPETLVHNMEHAGIVIWYNTTDQSIIDELEDFARDNDGKRLVLTPYPEMEEERVAITVWSRRDKFPVSEYDRKRLEEFIDKLYCKFDPEGFC